MPRAMARCSECEYHMTFNPKNMAQHLDIHGHQCWQMTILKPLQMLSSFPGIFDLHISSSISSIGLKHSQNEFGKEKKPWGNPWDNIVVKPGASSRWNRFPAFGFTRGLAALLVRVLGRFRYAYHLRPWECVMFMLVFHIIPIIGVGELDFFFVNDSCYECFQGFFWLWEISQSVQNKQMDLNSPTKTEPACRQLSNSLDIFKPFSNLLAWLLARCWELIAAKPFQPPESSKGFGG